MNELIRTLERRGVITTDPDRAEECCGLPRDADGFCTYRPGHPIYIDPDRVDNLMAAAETRTRSPHRPS